MPLTFITANPHKYEEARAILGIELQMLEVELPEIQAINPREIIKHKLEAALRLRAGGLIVDDTSLEFECLNGLPGAFVKWFLKTIGLEGLFKITQSFKNPRAVARCVVGLALSAREIHFFEGRVEGEIVAPRGSRAFGWDCIFQPRGFSKTYAELSPTEKNGISHRAMALKTLREFILINNLRFP